jgi:cytoskeletal protein CcmA (bactofilin family)
VNHSFAALLLVLLTGLFFMLPMLPAIVELRLKRDAQPLVVVQQYAGDIRHFAYGFRNYMAELQLPLQQCVASGTTARGILPKGDEYILLGGPHTASLLPVGKQDQTCALVVAAGSDILLPDSLTFSKEVFAAGEFVGGKRSTYRAVLGEKGIHLQEASKVLRWAHSAGELQAEHDCDLYGRISSEQGIRLQSGCVFQRLNAPRIAFGPAGVADPGSSVAVSEIRGDTGSLPEPGARTLVEGDREIPSGEVIRGNLVVRGRLHIHAGARVLGSVKSNKEMIVEAGVHVQGSLISAATMHIGRGCRIGGPVVAEHGMVIESGSECGAMGTPTTVSAPTVEVEEGVLVYGTLWARQEGRVVTIR